MYLLNNKLDKFINVFTQESQVASWISSGQSVISQKAFFSKRPVFIDVRNHLDLLSTLLHNDQVALNKQQIRNLTKNLLEYATNEVYTFRGNLLYSVVEKIASRASPDTLYTLIEALIVKQSEIYDRPTKIEIDLDGKREQNSELPLRIFNCLRFLLEQLVKLKVDLNYDFFTLILQAVSHPVSCYDKRCLKKTFSLIERLFGKENLAQMFITHINKIVE